METIVEHAKQFARQKLNDSLWRHSCNVLEISLILAKKESVSIDEDALAVGCYLHDIGIPSDQKNHPIKGKEIAKDFFGKNPMPEQFTKTVYDIILHHGSGEKPMTTEGLLACSADKISLFDGYNMMRLLFTLSKELETQEAVAQKLLAKIEKKYHAIPLQSGKELARNDYEHYKRLFSSKI